MDSPNPTRTVPSFKESPTNSIFSSLLSFPDSSPISIGSSFDRVLDKALISADESVKDRLVDHTLHLASLLHDSTKRCLRKRAFVHNFNSWFLPHELTVFSMLDTMSLMQAAACCTMFNKCSMDRLCYSHIDMTTSAKQDYGVVCAMIHRAGKELRSLKLGRVVRPAGSENTLPMVSTSCLSALSYNHGFLGSRLRSLRLYNLKPIYFNVLCDVLSVCSNITDLRIVGLYSRPEQLFKSIMVKCRLIVHLFLEADGSRDSLDSKSGLALVELVTSCPNLSSLTLIRFGQYGEMWSNLAKGSRNLKYINLSRSPYFGGSFLSDLILSCKDGPLETLILRNCLFLQKKEVLEFCDSLLTGDFKSIRHIDVSSNQGLLSNDLISSYNPNIPLEKLKEERPGVKFLADLSSTSSEKLDLVYNDVEEEELRLIEMMEGDKDNGDDEDEDYPSEEDEYF